MRVGRIFIIFLGILILTGCVSSQEYKARLADIDGLKKDVLSLEEQLKAKEAEKANLEGELSKLKKENADIKSLLDAKKDELTKNVTDLRSKVAEKEMRIKSIEDELKSKDMQISELKTVIAELSSERSKAIEEKEKAISELRKTHDNLIKELNEEIKKGEIAVTQLRDKLSLSMVDKILFDSGSADVKKEGKNVLDRVIEILKKVADKQIRIEGHTDNVLISPRLAKKFPTNWELSNTRATNVVRYLQEKGINPKLLSSAGYSEYKPVNANDTEEERAKNRRIEIVLIPLDTEIIKKD